MLGEHGPLRVIAHLHGTANCGLLQCLSTQQQPCKLNISVHKAPSVISAAALQLCTTLTSLDITHYTDNSAIVPWCQFVQKLTNLVVFDLSRGATVLHSVYEQEGLMQLSALTHWTNLSLNVDAGDAVVVTLVCALTGLRDLSTHSSGLRTAAVIPAAARLPKLEALMLWGDGSNGLQDSLLLLL